MLVLKRNIVPDPQIYVGLIAHKVSERLHFEGLFGGQLLLVFILLGGVLLVANLDIRQNSVDLILHIGYQGGVVHCAHCFRH